jgi:DNA-binding MarR family transcriptional regulator
VSDETQPPLTAQQAAEIRQGVLRLSWRMRARRAGGALSSTKLAILVHLHATGPATPGEISAAGDHQPQALTRALADLAHDDLLTRTRDHRDGRQSLLTITAAGRAALRADMADRDAWLADALTTLTDTEREVLRLAARLMERLAGGAAR